MKIIAAVAALIIFLSWPGTSQAIVIHGVKSFVERKGDGEFIACNAFFADIDFAAKLSSAPRASFKNIIVLDPSPQNGCGIKPKSGSDENQSSRKPSYPPVWHRIPLAFILGLGSNGVFMYGVIQLDDKKRKLWGRVLCGCAFLMFVGGIALMLALGFPATWGWWV